MEVIMKLLTIFISVLSVAVIAQAAPKKKACNDLKVTQCKKRQDCTWVKKSKNGKAAYCRKSAKKKK